MAFYIDMSTVLDTFKTEVTVYPPKGEGEYIDGEWHESATEPVTYYEPLVPNSLQTAYSLMTILRDTGHVDQYNAVWVSKQDYPTQTVVEHDGVKYRVVDIINLKTYSNVNIYYLQSEEGNDGNKL